MTNAFETLPVFSIIYHIIACVIGCFLREFVLAALFIYSVAYRKFRVISSAGKVTLAIFWDSESCAVCCMTTLAQKPITLQMFALH